MAYYCVHCDHEFEPEGKGRPRCPKCMRANDLKEVSAKAAQEASEGDKSEGSKASKISLVGIFGFLGVVALVIGGWLLWDGGGASDAEVEAKAEALSAALEKHGIDADAERWLRADEQVEAFAEQAAGDASGDAAKAEAVVKAIRERAQATAFIPWSLSEARTGKARPPAELVEVLEKDGGRAQLYPLEVVAFAVAALRSQGVPAVGVEMLTWPAAKAPLDPGGVAGYFALGVGDEVYDVFRGQTVPAKAKHVALSDAQLVAAGLSLEALQEMSDEGDTREATKLSEAALKLAPKSPTARSVRGAIWAGSGAIEQGLEEFEAAAQLRSDPARRYNQASAAILARDTDRAATALNKLVTEFPDYALARVSIAALELQRGNVAEAERQLDMAEQAAPDLSAVHWGRAELALAQGDTLQAKTLARRAFDARPTLESHMRLARVQRQAGDLEGAVETVRAALKKVPSYRESDLRQAFSATLGPAVMMDLEAAEQAENGASDDEVPAGDSEFDLSKGLKLLGDEESGGGPSLAPKSAKDDEPLLLLGDPSKLRLRDDDSTLQLELSQ